MLRHGCKILCSILLIQMLMVPVFALDYPNGGHMHQHKFTCYERWELLCSEEHVHFAACYRGRDRRVCNMKEGKYYTVSQMANLKENSIPVTIIQSCGKEAVNETVNKTITRTWKDYTKGKHDLGTFTSIAREQFVNLVKAVNGKVDKLHLHDEKCFQTLYLYRAKYLV